MRVLPICIAFGTASPGWTGCAAPADGGLIIDGARIPAQAVVGPAALYLSVRNDGSAADTLLRITAAPPLTIELHRTLVDSVGGASMARAGPVGIAPGEEARLEPGGLHGMVRGTAAPLRAGDTVTVTLEFQSAGAVAVRVPVRSPG